MSLQQVNLFLPEFRPEQGTFNFVTMIYAWIGIVVFLALVQVWGWNQTQNAREKLAAIEDEQVKVLRQLKELRDATPKETKAQMQENIEEAEAAVMRRRQVLRTMQGRAIGNTEGFSRFLVGLSNQHMDGLALDRFSFLNGGNYVELSGWTYKPELVPDYMQRLQREDSFEETRFGEMSIERIAAQRNDALKFVLGTDEGDS